MTEAWKSNPNYFCEVCRVWMPDNTQSRAVHERGAKHRENVTQRLSEMRKRADNEKKEAAQAKSAMASIEAAAAARYEEDQREAAEHAAAALGRWEYKAETGYYYNAAQRWYYDAHSRQYYGGEPADWTQNPPIPREARYEVMTRPPPPPGPAPAREGGARPAGAAAAGVAAAAAAAGRVLPGMRISATASHPQAGVGGAQMPTDGRIGGARGVGEVQAKKKEDPSGKRKREGGSRAAPAAALPQAEIDALAAREAARQRVQQRTKAQYGLL